MLTLILTVTSGVAVFVGSQVILRFFIEPVYDLRRAIGEVGDVLISYAPLYLHPKEISPQAGDYSAGSPLPEVSEIERGDASDALRQKASLLFARANVIPKYNWFARLNWVPPWDSLLTAHKELINLSNSISTGNPLANETRRRIIADALQLNLGF